MGKDQKFMNYIFIFGSVLLLLLILYIILQMIQKNRFPYAPKYLLTKREYHFYQLLRKVADEYGYIICPKVGVKDLLAVTSCHQYMKYFHKIAQKHIDFVVCDHDLHVIFALELDDSSHDTKEAMERDKFKDRAFKSAGIPLKRIRNYDLDSIYSLFR